MRKLFTLFIAITMAAFSNAQTISGSLKDEAGKPVNGATVSLHKAKDSAIAKIAVSNKDGMYSFNTANAGKYFVSVSGVGFTKANSNAFDYNGSQHDVAGIALTKSSKQLNEVTVTSKKPMIEVKADKTIFNIEGSINAVGTDAFELLRKSPGVLIDKDDNVQLSGKNGVRVYIDGRPSPLAGKELADYLRTMQSSSIEAIELITNPSAKYDAAGNAGIVNIRLKKNKAFGSNGSVNAGWAIGTYPKYNAGVNLNHRDKLINLFGNYNYNNNIGVNTLNINRTLLDTNFNQTGTMKNNTLTHSFKAGLDYYASKKSTFGIILDGNYTNTDFSNYGNTPTTYVPSQTQVRTLVADNSALGHRNNINLNGNYKYADTSGHELNIDANYGHFDNDNDQMQPNYYSYNAVGVKNDTAIYRMISPSKIDIANVKADYEQRFAGGKLELGIKTSHVKTTNNFQRYNVASISKDEKTLDRNNKFTYIEKINAAYVNFNKQYKGFMIQAGLRMEHSIVTGRSTGSQLVSSGVYSYSDSSFERNYVNLFPSAAITFNKNPMSQWSLTYSRRIDRPAYQDLNPFEFKLDDYTFQRGSTTLTPQYTNSFGISHTYKYMLTTSLNYSHVTDILAQLIDTIDKSKSFISKKNLATQDIVNLNISYPFQKGIYSAFFNLSGFYAHYKADFGVDRQVNLDVVSGSFYMQNSFRLKKGYTAEVSGFVATPSIHEGTLKSKWMGNLDVGIQKQILQGKGNIKLSVSDILNTMRWAGSSSFAGQNIDASFKWESRQLKLNFTYRFGKTTVKSARQRSTGVEDESKRVKSGGGGIGG